MSTNSQMLSSVSGKILITWFWQSFLKSKGIFLILAMFFMSLEGGMMGAFSYSIKAMFDNAFSPNSVITLWIIGAVIFIIFVTKALAGLGQRIIISWVAQSIEKTLQHNLLLHLISLDTKYFSSNSPGLLIERMRVDTRAITSSAGLVFMTLGRDSVSLLSLLAVAIYIDWLWTLIAFVGAPVLVIPVLLLQNWVRKISNWSREIDGNLTTMLDEIFHGISAIKLNSLQDYKLAQFSHLLEMVRKIRLKMELGIAGMPALIDVIAGVGFLGVMIFGGGQIVSGVKTVGEFMAFFTAMALIFEPIRRLSNISGSLQIALASAEKVYLLFNEEATVENQGKKFLNTQVFKESNVKFENVSKKYGENIILKNLNFEIPSGKTVALVGDSGSGKSTVIKLLSRLVQPDSGRILIGDTDIAAIDIKTFRKQFAVVTQENVLFDDTIYENIFLGDLNSNDSRVLQSAVDSYVVEFTDRFPNKLETFVGPRGENLSGGQRQRVNIGRALLRNAPILLLDEPTSALDAKSEALMQKTFKRLHQNKTILVVAHRLSTIVDADLIIVLDKGQVVDQGNHESLMTKSGIYSELVKLQMINIKE